MMSGGRRRCRWPNIVALPGRWGGFVPPSLRPSLLPQSMGRQRPRRSAARAGAAGRGRHGGALRRRGGKGRRRAPAWAAAGPGDERSLSRDPPREYGHSRVQKEDAQERGHVVRGGQSEVGAGGAAGGASGGPAVPGPCSPPAASGVVRGWGQHRDPRDEPRHRCGHYPGFVPQGHPGAGEWQLPVGPSRWRIPSILPKQPHTRWWQRAAVRPCTPRTLSLWRGDSSPEPSLPLARPQHPQGFICWVGKERVRSGFVRDGSL